MAAPNRTGSTTPAAALPPLLSGAELSSASKLAASGGMPEELLFGVPLSVALSNMAGSLPSRGSCRRAATEGEQGTLLGLRQHFDDTVSIASCVRELTLSKVSNMSFRLRIKK